MYPYHDDWHDMSDYVVHFTKPCNGSNAYENCLSILADRLLEARTPFGIARYRAPLPLTQCSVCFSEVPLHLINRLVERRGSYGVGFTKDHILQRGGGPIWYVENGSEMSIAMNLLIEQALGTNNPDEEPIWRITPFIDLPGDYPGGAYRFEWEREWRIVGDLQFSENDVAFLIIPEELHQQARIFFENALQDHIGPAYLCPYIDASWSRDQVEATLRN